MSAPVDAVVTGSGNPYSPPESPATESEPWKAPALIGVPLRVIGIPLMVAIYVGIAFPLSIVCAMDWLFDRVAAVCGFDPRYWPLPKGQDEDFRWRRPRCERCRLAVD